MNTEASANFADRLVNVWPLRSSRRRYFTTPFPSSSGWFTYFYSRAFKCFLGGDCSEGHTPLSLSLFHILHRQSRDLQLCHQTREKALVPSIPIDWIKMQIYVSMFEYSMVLFFWLVWIQMITRGMNNPVLIVLVQCKSDAAAVYIGSVE